MKTQFIFVTIHLSFLFSVFETSNAQAPDWLWAKSIGGTDYDYGSSIAIDNSGNVFTIGEFQHTVDFDPGSNTFNLTSAGYNDIFITKLDSSGNFIWAKEMGGTDNDFGRSIKLDATGNIYIVGNFFGTSDFNPDTLAAYNLTSGAWGSIFISKLDNAGNFLWAKAMDGTGTGEGHSIVLDEDDNVYITGYFTGTIDFDPSTLGIFNLTTIGGGDIFISKLDSSGNFLWAKDVGCPIDDRGISIAIDTNENSYIVGIFSGTADFDPDSFGTFNLTSAGGNDIFILKLNSLGNFVWAKTIGGLGDEIVMSIALDKSGSSDFYITGYFGGTIDFDPGLATFNLTADSFSHKDIYISKFDSSGSFLWVKSMGGINDDIGLAIAVDPAGSGNIYTTGYFKGIADFDPNPLGTLNFTSEGKTDMYVSKLDAMGNNLWAKTVGGTGNDYGYSITLDFSGKVYLTGTFYSPTCQFNSIFLTNADPTGFYSDIFIAKLDHISTGIERIDNNNDVSIYPNPANNCFTLALAGNRKKILVNVTDITGKIIYKEFYYETKKIEVNTTNFSEGVYLVQIKSEYFIETKKLLIAK